MIKICVWTCDMTSTWGPQEVTSARWTQPSGPLCLWQCFLKLVVWKLFLLILVQDNFFAICRSTLFFAKCRYWKLVCKLKTICLQILQIAVEGWGNQSGQVGLGGPGGQGVKVIRVVGVVRWSFWSAWMVCIKKYMVCIPSNYWET